MCGVYSQGPRIEVYIRLNFNIPKLVYWFFIHLLHHVEQSFLFFFYKDIKYSTIFLSWMSWGNDNISTWHFWLNSFLYHSYFEITWIMYSTSHANFIFFLTGHEAYLIYTNTNYFSSTTESDKLAYGVLIKCLPWQWLDSIVYPGKHILQLYWWL